ncbi:MAG TPA: precorrin-6A reductase [Syntrophomonadaceae bacterium]|nr:precorrin-6A reductase [Syntrophomonadaceae bacterium]
MIIVLAGTQEGREIAALLQEAGYLLLASVTSEMGEQILRRQGIRNIRQGKLSREGLIQLIQEGQATMLVDATHPFAQVISLQAMEAAAQMGIPYVRLERAPYILPEDPLIITIARLEELRPLISPGTKVFATLGIKSLEVLAPLVREEKANLVARVLPHSTALKVCEDLGLSPEQIVALKGPYSRELNRVLFREYRVGLVVTKESGEAGGLDAKIQAALDLELPIVVWRRPVMRYPVAFQTTTELLKYIENI